MTRTDTPPPVPPSTASVEPPPVAGPPRRLYQWLMAGTALLMAVLLLLVVLLLMYARYDTAALAGLLIVLLGLGAHASVNSRATVDALRRRERTLSALIATLPETLVQLRRDGTLVEVYAKRHDMGHTLANQYATLFRAGARLQDAPSHFPGTVTEEDVAVALAAVDHALTTRRIQSYEIRHTIMNSPLVFENVVVPLNDDEALLVSRDVTERVAVAGALQQYALRLDILRSVDNAILQGLPLADIAAQALAFLHYMLPSRCGFLLDTTDHASSNAVVVASQNAVGQPLMPVGTTLNLRHTGALRQGQTDTVPLVGAFDTLSKLELALAVNGASVYVQVPLARSNRTMGALVLGYENHADTQDLEHLALLQEVAGLLALAMEQQRLTEQLTVHTQDLEKLVQQRSLEMIREKERAEAVFTHSSDALALVDDVGRVLQVNAAFARLVGALGRTVTGLTLDELVDEHARPGVRALLETAISARAPRRAELTFTRPDGAEVPVDASVSPLTPYLGSWGGDHELLVSLRDMSSRKRVEGELRSALAKERDLSELKSRFVSTISHEFRTPLATILSSTGLLLLGGPLMAVERRERHLRKIEAAVMHMTRMMDDVVLMGAAEANRLTFSPQHLAVRPLLDEVIEEVRSATPHAVNVVVEVPPSIDTVEADEKLLHQILANLLNNAVKYSPPGQEVRVSLGVAEDAAVWRVSDHGLGIPDAAMPHLFTMFYRADNVGHLQGTGLGLAIVERAVTRHGGSVTAACTAEAGTVFTVRLPHPVPTIETKETTP